MRKLLLSLVLALGLGVGQAWAGRVYFNGAAGEQVVGANSCTRVAKQSPNAGEHTFVVMRCDDVGDDVAVFHFNWPADAPAPGAGGGYFVDLWVQGDGSAVANASFRYSIACADPSTLVNAEYTALPRPTNAGCGGSDAPFDCCTGAQAGLCEETIGASMPSSTETTRVIKAEGGNLLDIHCTSIGGTCSPNLADSPCALYIQRNTTDAYAGSVDIVAVQLRY